MKIALRKWLILTHRYLGIPLSFLFLMWFASGIAMIFARGMPSLTPELRLERMPPLNLDAVKISLSDAAEKGQVLVRRLARDSDQRNGSSGVHLQQRRFCTSLPITGPHSRK